MRYCAGSPFKVSEKKILHIKKLSDSWFIKADNVTVLAASKNHGCYKQRSNYCLL